MNTFFLWLLIGLGVGLIVFPVGLFIILKIKNVFERRNIKRLIKHGNSRALIVDKALLEAAGISEDAFFQVSINPNGGLIIQSVEEDRTDVFRKSFEKLNKKYKKLMKNLADL